MTFSRLSIGFLAAPLLFGQLPELNEPPRRSAKPPLVSATRPVEAQSSTTRTAGEAWYNTSNRAEVVSKFQTVFQPAQTVPMGWTGNVAAGIAGDTSAEYKEAVRTTINYFRAMAGVPPVITLDPVYSSKAQKAALMMAANKALSHTPPESWLFWSKEGAEAAGSSNLCYQYGLSLAAGCVATYMVDHGASNSAVGHRRWLLHPATQKMGTGDIALSSGYPSTNALWVFDDNLWAPRPLTRDTFVAWPPKGYVPHQLIYSSILGSEVFRWSFSYPDADFATASVEVRRGTTVLPITLEPVLNGYSDNTIVFKPVIGTAVPASDTTYTVTVSNVLIAGAPRSFTYDVTVIGSGGTVTFVPSSILVGSAGSSGSFQLLASPPGTSWSLSSDSPAWLTIAPPASGTGNATVFYTYATNPGPARTGVITAGGDTPASFTVFQSGTSGCGFTVAPTGPIAVGATGASGSLVFTASNAGCTWTAASSAPWAQVFPLSGTGTRNITYTIFPNYTTAARSATFTIGGITVTFNQAAAAGNNNRRFIGQMYFNFFGRIPSTAEVDFMESALNGGLPRPDFVMNFFNSAEFNGAGRFIAGLYVGILNRNAEYGGWLFIRNALSTGTVPKSQLVTNFIDSDEFKLNNPSLTNRQFAALMYKQILLRDGTAAELDWMQGLLDTAALTRVQMAANFLDSAEFRLGTGPRLTTFLLYACLLLRDASAGEFAALETLLKGGSAPRTEAEKILASAEFTALLN